MSDFDDLSYDIEQLYIDGLSAKRIAKELNCPLKVVEQWIRNIGVAETPHDEEKNSYFGA